MSMRGLPALVVAIVVGTFVLPGAAYGQSGDSVAGSVTLFQGAGGDVRLDVDAHSGPSGENPTGHLTLDFPQFPTPIEASVACLRVSGNTGIVGVNFLNAGAPSGFFKVVDALVDTVNLAIGSTVLGPGDCPADVIDNPLTVTSGDLVVIDAQPFPTSKDQCTNDRWRDFPGFKNQGDCLSWVATHGKNPPGGH
jgi:hypothetical protein